MPFEGSVSNGKAWPTWLRIPDVSDVRVVGSLYYWPAASSAVGVTQEHAFRLSTRCSEVFVACFSTATSWETIRYGGKNSGGTFFTVLLPSSLERPPFSA